MPADRARMAPDDDGGSPGTSARLHPRRAKNAPGGRKAVPWPEKNEVAGCYT